MRHISRIFSATTTSKTAVDFVRVGPFQYLKAVRLPLDSKASSMVPSGIQCILAHAPMCIKSSVYAALTRQLLPIVLRQRCFGGFLRFVLQARSTVQAQCSASCSSFTCFVTIVGLSRPSTMH